MSDQKQCVYYVSPEGDDAAAGTVDAPFASLERARDAVRDLKESGELKVSVTVLIRGGTYELEDTVVFGPEDSGSRECPVTYAAFRDETPVFTGGSVIEGDWKKHDGEIMALELDAPPYFRQLTVNGRRKSRTRTPNEGYFETEEALSGTSFRYAEGDMMSYQALDDAEVVIIHSWNESRLKISKLDEGTRTVEFHDPKARHEVGWTGTRGPNRYFVENTLEGLTQPGEWYLDRATATLYYWPEEDLKGAVVTAPKLRQLVRFDGDLAKEQFVEYIRFEGLTFTDTEWDLDKNGYPDCGDVGDIVDPATITYTAARHCEFRKNTIKNTGTYALEINGYDNLVEDNEIYDTGSGGILTRNLHAEHNTFRYNHIHDCCREYPSGVGINIDEGGGTFVHNLIHGIGHSGIYARHWATETQAIERRNQEQELRIEYNEIYDVSTIVDDSGGIFIRDSNIIIRNNLIHDNHSGHKRCPGWGIYLGCETRDTLVENNLVYNCLESLHVWYKNRNITVTNNIFVDCEQFQINFGNPSHLSHENIRIIGNVFYQTNANSQLFTVHGERSLPVVSDYNVIFSAISCVLVDPVITRLEGIDSLEQWQGLGLDANTITADPEFVDMANDDYTLKPTSPAFKLGFRPIDFSNVGLRGRK